MVVCPVVFVNALDTNARIGYSNIMYSVKEAAQKMGISPRQLRFLLQQGQIEGKKLGHDWVVLSLDYKRKRKPKRRAEQ